MNLGLIHENKTSRKLWETAIQENMYSQKFWTKLIWERKPLQNYKKKIHDNKKQQFGKLNYCQKKRKTRKARMIVFLYILITITMTALMLCWKEMLNCELMVLKVSEKF